MKATTVKTRFSINDECYVMSNNEVIKGYIKRIQIIINDDDIFITYYVFLGTDFEGDIIEPYNHNKIFSTKQKLLKSL